MRQKHVKILIGVITLVIAIFVIYSNFDSIMVAPRDRVSNLVNRLGPSEFHFYIDTTEASFNDIGDIESFSDMIGKKKAKRVSKETSDSLMREPIAVFDYGYKGTTIEVSKDGRIAVYVSKDEIRNQSPIHWLWWKANITKDRYNYVMYVTEPDVKVAEKMIEIINKVANMTKRTYGFP